MRRSRAIYIIGIVTGAALALAACSGGTNREKEEQYRQLGMNCMQGEDYKGAVEAFQKSLDQCRGGITDLELDTCYYKAEAQYLSGDYEGAYETYSAIIDYNEDARAYFLRGALYYKTGTHGKESGGAQDLKLAIEKDADDCSMYIGVYEVLAAAGDPDGNAKDYLETVLNMKGRSSADKMYKGYAYHLLEDDGNAETMLSAAAGEGEDKAWYYLTEIYESLGETQSADRAFDKYLSSGLAGAQELYQIGQTMAQQDRQERAVECFRRAADAGNGQIRQLSLKHLIVVCEELGDFQTAKKEMEIYAKEYPDDASMEKERTFLKSRILSEKKSKKEEQSGEKDSEKETEQSGEKDSEKETGQRGDEKEQ